MAARERGVRAERVENTADKLPENVNQLIGAYQHLATKDDVSRAKQTIILWLVVVGVTLAAIQVIIPFQLSTRFLW